MKHLFLKILLTGFIAAAPAPVWAQAQPETLIVEEEVNAPALGEEDPDSSSLTFDQYDDRYLLKFYLEKYYNLSKEILWAMIKDETLTSYKSAAAIKIFREKFTREIVGREKKIIEKQLLRRLNRTDSAFVQTEIMHTLIEMDRYRYFKSMIPALIQKLDHYNAAVNKLAFDSLDVLIDEGNNRNREARIVFNTLRKVLFLSKKRLANVVEPDIKLTQKLQLLRWSIKVLGSQELKRLPKEVISLL